MAVEISADISPVPTPEEREALLRALAALDAPDVASAWWEAGVRESVEDGEDEP